MKPFPPSQPHLLQLFPPFTLTQRCSPFCSSGKPRSSRLRALALAIASAGKALPYSLSMAACSPFFRHQLQHPLLRQTSGSVTFSPKSPYFIFFVTSVVTLTSSNSLVCVHFLPSIRRLTVPWRQALCLTCSPVSRTLRRVPADNYLLTDWSV